MDRSGKPVAKSQGVIEEREETRTKKLVDRMQRRDDKAKVVTPDDILASSQQAVQVLRNRVEELEARVKLNCPGCQEREDKIAQLREQVGQRLIDLDAEHRVDRAAHLERIEALEAKLTAQNWWDEKGQELLDRMRKRDERTAKVESDHVHLGQGWSEIDDRQNKLEKDNEVKTEIHDRTTAILDKVADHNKVVDGEVEKLLRDVVFLMAAVSAIKDDRNCEHEPICLPSSRGPVPILVIEIADARKMDIIRPGQPPPIAFAIAMCKKCGAAYVFINTLEEAAPFEGGPAPVTTVEPGGVIQ